MAYGQHGPNIPLVLKPAEPGSNQELEHVVTLPRQAVEVTVRAQRRKRKTVIQQLVLVHDN